MGAEVVAPERHEGEDGAPAPALIDGERHQLYERLVSALRDYGAQSGRMVEVFASAQQMHRTDLHALLVIMNTQSAGRCATPKVLTEALNLTSGAVTGVVDRLVRSGHVERETDNFDRRQVKLVHRAPATAVARDFLEPLGSRMEELMAGYSLEELATVERFLSGATQVLTDHVRSLAGPPKDA